MRVLARLLGNALIGGAYIVYLVAGMWAFVLIVQFVGAWWEIDTVAALAASLIGLPAALTIVPLVAAFSHGQWQILLIEVGALIVGAVLTRPGAALIRWGERDE